MEELNDVQIRMLEAEQFHIDGWMRPTGRIAALDLLEKKFVTMFESSSEQYTVWNFTITKAGREALAATHPAPQPEGE